MKLLSATSLSSLTFPSRPPALSLSLFCLAPGPWRTQTGRSLSEGIGYEQFGKSSPLCEEEIGRCNAQMVGQPVDVRRLSIMYPRSFNGVLFLAALP